jgi:DNA polymerase-3 subunit beta
MGEAVKFQCERDALVDGLATTGRAVAQRAASGALTTAIRMDAQGSRLTLTATDLSLTLRVSVDAVGSEDGICMAPARLVTEIVRAMEPGAVTVTGSDTEIEVTGGRSRFVMQTYAPALFPTIPEHTDPQVTLPATELTEAIDQVARAASTDPARPLLCGVMFAKEGSGWRLVATDSYRLAWRDLSAEMQMPPETESVIVPARALTELERLCKGEPNAVGVSVGPLDATATFSVRGVHLTTRLLEGHFPDYQVLVPSECPTGARVQKALLTDALRRMKLLVKDQSTPVRLATTDAGIDLSVVSPDFGSASETVEASVKGPEIQTAFNPTFLIEGIDAVSGDEVAIDMTDATHPALISSPTSRAYRCLLMPIRVS